MKRIFYLSAVVIIIATIACSGTYLYRFHNGLSSNHDDWGDFGSYFSGTIGVILSGFNAFAFVYLTYRIYRRDDERHLIELRSPFYKEIIAGIQEITISQMPTPERCNSFANWMESLDFESLLFLKPGEAAELIKCQHQICLTLRQLAAESKYVDNMVLVAVGEINLKEQLGNIKHHLRTIMVKAAK